MKPLIPLDLLMRSVIVPLIPSLIHVGDWDEDRPTVIATHFPGMF
jgi:hypothetical protein